MTRIKEQVVAREQVVSQDGEVYQPPDYDNNHIIKTGNGVFKDQSD